MERRRFLFLCSAAATGIWLASTGLVPLSRRLVVELGGACSFCGKSVRDGVRLAGTTGRADRICHECVGLCLDILGEELGVPVARPRAASPSIDDETLAESYARLDRIQDEAEFRRALEDARRRYTPAPPAVLQTGRLPLACSFCDASQRDVAKLIAGPAVYVCDACAGDAACILRSLG